MNHLTRYIKYYFIIAFSCIINLLSAQTLWETWVSQECPARKLITTHDSSYIVIFYSANDGATHIIKYNKLGNILWNKYIPLLNHSAYDVVESTSHNFFIDGFRQSFLFIAKLDYLGNLIWKHYYQSFSPFNITIGNNEEIFLFDDKYLKKFNNNGLLIKESRYFGYYNYPVFNNGYIFNNNSFISVKINENLEDLWTKVENNYNGLTTLSYDSSKVLKLNANLYLNTGYFYLLDFNTMDSLYAKGVSDYSLWQSQGINSVIATPDSGYLMTGTAQIGGPEFEFAIKTDSLGFVEWSKIYAFGYGNRIVNAVNATDGPGYVILVSNDDVFQSFLVRVGIYGELVGEKILPFSDIEEGIKIYPNPVVNTLNADFIQNITGNYNIYSISGKLLKQGIINNTNTITIEVRELKAGIYIIVINNDNKTMAKTFIKQINTENFSK